jgi:type II pantothenate kinase
MIIGLDLGASTTKAVVVDGKKIIKKLTINTTRSFFPDVKALENIVVKIKSQLTINLVAITGGKARSFGDSFLGLPVVRVDEIQAIGLGGLALSRKKKGLVVSIGTGTALVASYEGRSVKHVGGTGVGGGTVLGLSKRLLSIDDFLSLEALALNGDSGNIDLMVADVVGGSIGIVPSDATASNFGRMTNQDSKEDIAAGIISLVSQVVGVVSAMAAKAYGLEDDIILVGQLVKSDLVSRTIQETAHLFGTKAIVPTSCEYHAALGAALYAGFC